MLGRRGAAGQSQCVAIQAPHPRASGACHLVGPDRRRNVSGVSGARPRPASGRSSLIAPRRRQFAFATPTGQPSVRRFRRHHPPLGDRGHRLQGAVPARPGARLPRGILAPGLIDQPAAAVIWPLGGPCQGGGSGTLFEPPPSSPGSEPDHLFRKGGSPFLRTTARPRRP